MIAEKWAVSDFFEIVKVNRVMVERLVESPEIQEMIAEKATKAERRDIERDIQEGYESLLLLLPELLNYRLCHQFWMGEFKRHSSESETSIPGDEKLSHSAYSDFYDQGGKNLRKFVSDFLRA